MNLDNPVIRMVSLLMLFGPILLFWHIDWYWVVGYYNILFSYFSYTHYRKFEEDPRFRNKIPLLIYILLPLILSFIGYLICIVNGFEDIPESEIQAMENITMKDLEDIDFENQIKINGFKKFK